MKVEAFIRIAANQTPNVDKSVFNRPLFLMQVCVLVSELRGIGLVLYEFSFQKGRKNLSELKNQKVISKGSSCSPGSRKPGLIYTKFNRIMLERVLIPIFCMYCKICTEEVCKRIPAQICSPYLCSIQEPCICLCSGIIKLPTNFLGHFISLIK